LKSLNYTIYPLKAIEFYKKPRYLYGLINELNRVKNFLFSKIIISKKTINSVYISSEEEHFLATVSYVKSINNDVPIIHLEEGSIVHIDSFVSKQTYPNSGMEKLKFIRKVLRRLYFGINELKNLTRETYGRADFYSHAVVLNNKNLSERLGGDNHVELSPSLFISVLENLFNFNSKTLETLLGIEKIILFIADGNKSVTEPKIYINIINEINKLSKERGYVFIIKNHPLNPSYLNLLTPDIKVIDENLPVEYFLIKLNNNLKVIGGKSTSLGVSKILGLNTYSIINIYNSQYPKNLMDGMSYLDAFGIEVIGSYEEILA
jgi:hypothetical protein